MKLDDEVERRRRRQSFEHKAVRNLRSERERRSEAAPAAPTPPIPTSVAVEGARSLPMGVSSSTAVRGIQWKALKVGSWMENSSPLPRFASSVILI